MRMFRVMRRAALCLILRGICLMPPLFIDCFRAAICATMPRCFSRYDTMMPFAFRYDAGWRGCRYANHFTVY